MIFKDGSSDVHEHEEYVDQHRMDAGSFPQSSDRLIMGNSHTLVMPCEHPAQLVPV
jgi:hypothetical protein